MVHGKERAMVCAPCEKGPSRAMPETAEDHCQKEIRITPWFAKPIAAERDVKVVSQKARERHVPAAPEVDDAFSAIGRIEIIRQPDIEHPAQANRHVAV